jgi:NAD(P)-dependent dehydrogenase (short-subunit alcohol dehydrogenase family)
LVTGANRGLGRHLAQQLRDRGATVYAGARNPSSVDLDGVTTVALDVTDAASVLSWISFANIGAYCAAKSAAWSSTNALRQELGPQRTLVSALHVGYMDTDMTSGVDAPKSDPADIARIALDGIAAGIPEIVADEISKSVLAGLSGGVAALYPQLA